MRRGVMFINVDIDHHRRPISTTTVRIEGGVGGEDGQTTSLHLSLRRRGIKQVVVLVAEPFSYLLPVLYPVHVLMYGLSLRQVHVHVL
jgi:hypothetical protein